MDELLINGSNEKVEGEIKVSASKNAALPLMTASILCSQPIRFNNLPALRDINSMTELLNLLGVSVDNNENYTEINAKNIDNYVAEYDVVRKMRASILVLAPLLVRFGKAKVSLPGGCAIGSRPVDLHLKALEKMGTEIQIESGYIHAKVNQLKGATIDLAFPSVGATENILMAASFAEGKTIINNAAREPEIIQLGDFLKKVFDLPIEGLGTSKIEIEGLGKYTEDHHSVDFQIIGDRIEAATYIIAGLIKNSEIEVTGFNPKDIQAVLGVLEEMGFQFDYGENSIKTLFRSDGFSQIRCPHITTGPYPEFPTDVQAQMMTLLCLIPGTSTMTENIFENRFMHVPELSRMGAQIELDGKLAKITGVNELTGAPVMCTDLRASAALVLAGLVAEGSTRVRRVYHLDRGYEKIDEKLQLIGVDIKRVKG